MPDRTDDEAMTDFARELFPPTPDTEDEGLETFAGRIFNRNSNDNQE